MEFLAFGTPRQFRRWLATHHADSKGIWIRFAKKGADLKSLSHAEALDQALCYGWIDGQAKPLDEVSWVRRFTPRRPGSGWSKINAGHAERLIEAGLMALPGKRQVEEAKADGRWSAAYPPSRNAAPPADFLEELGKDKKAKAFFDSLSKANVYSIVYRLHTAKKPETRRRRMKAILAMMAEGRKFHP